jgi:hypothetical protein
MTEYVSYPRAVSDPAADGVPEYADDESTAFDDVDSAREADGPDPAPLPADREDGPLALDEFGTTAEEQRTGESLDARLAREQPDVPETGAADEVGHLVRPDLGLGGDDVAEEYATEMGFAGGGESAEEQAMHLVDEP